VKGWNHTLCGPVGEHPDYYHDPALDVPFHCPWCGGEGTREDVVAISDDAGRTGLLCCWCFAPEWDEVEA